MNTRVVRTSSILASALIVGVLAAPAFAQSYGAMPRGACAKPTRVSSVAPAQVQPQHQQTIIQDSGDAAPVRQRSRRARGFGSPF